MKRRPFRMTQKSTSNKIDDTQWNLSNKVEIEEEGEIQPSDKFNYALLVVLYTLQGIPMGLSASIPFLLQEKIQKMTAAAAATAGVATATVTSAAVASEASRATYDAIAIFALCSWPFSLKLLWAPIVDACFFKRFGRRKSWLIPIQTLAGLIMVGGSDFVERQLGLGNADPIGTMNDSVATMNIKGVTAFFFALYFLMATQDIAVDGWALTMLSKKNRGKGPICNSIGQNIGYFLSFVGFLALNDIESSETLWRPLLRLPKDPSRGLVSLKGFLRFMGFFMLLTTAVVALFKKEIKAPPVAAAANNKNDVNNKSKSNIFVRLKSTSSSDVGKSSSNNVEDDNDDDDDAELDAAQIGLKETYHRLWAVSKLPAVRSLFIVLVTYRLPTALSDNVKFLKAVEYGLSKSTTAILSPTIILPLGILVPLVASKIWHAAPLRQFMRAYEWRVVLIPLLDVFMLRLLKSGQPHDTSMFWGAVIASTAGQAICNSLQFNAQMTFFASRVDPAIGGSYMTLLNTMANLGGTWPASFVMKLLGWLTPSGTTASWFRGDPYEVVQTIFSVLGILWIIVLGPVVGRLAALPDDAWRTHLLDDDNDGNNNKTKNKNKKDDSNKNKNNSATTKVINRKRNNNLNITSNMSNSMRMGAMELGWKEVKNDGKTE